MEIYYINSFQLDIFLKSLKKDYKIFSPKAIRKDSSLPDYHYNYLNEDNPLIFNPYRCREPLKSFFSPAFEKLADYFNSEKINYTEEKIIVLGVKNCDLIAHKVQDFVFLAAQEIDPLYKLRRENIILISSDCTDFKEVCHCLAWEILPYPKEGFDLNLSPLNEGYLVEVGSVKGRELIQRASEYFVPAKEVQISSRQVKRKNLEERLRKHVLVQNLVSKDIVQKLVKEGYNLDTWQEFMLTCVECGGCNFICDTCHCFLLMDKKEESKNSRFRVWDSCQYANFARVAGGANPLKTRAKRLRNRFLKKFDFFVENLGMPACCGCGRCIEVCPGKIDIREVLKDLAKKLEKL